VAWWQYALIAFVIAWVIQAFGVWRQTRHYQSVFSELRKNWSDGALGAGAAPAKFGKGAIVLVVVDPQKTVRAVRIMQGRSVFAKFEPRPEFEGLSVADLSTAIQAPGFQRPLSTAIAQALAQIDKVASRRTGAAAATTAKLISA
jgi:glucitol operon activator protein